MSTMRRAVQKSDELPAPLGEFLTLPRPLDFPGPILSIIAVLGEAGSPIQEGLGDLRKIIAIRREWKGKDDESFQEAIAIVRRKYLGSPY